MYQPSLVSAFLSFPHFLPEMNQWSDIVRGTMVRPGGKVILCYSVLATIFFLESQVRLYELYVNLVNILSQSVISIQLI